MSTYGKRRALGQHFLRDTQIAQTIAETAIQEATQHQCKSLLEIGPGQGAITLPLLELLKNQTRIEQFSVVEKDEKFAQNWKNQSAQNFKVHAGDFLDFQDETWLSKSPMGVVSNLPYSVGTVILGRLARRTSEIPVMVLMFQAEVAQRVRAEIGTRDVGSLSLWIQNHWDVKKLLAVPPRAFTPPPEVQSEVIVLTRREQPRIEVAPEAQALWESFLKSCFAHRRKMLRSSFPWRNALELSGVDGTKRPEALRWDEWSHLFHSVQKVVKPSS